ncbi:MAG: ABC transporter permease [Tannerellaceae bacterium]|jgi:putative ABC transport system permease protein|nr:ABC transporter permease [Tannerellaceae bacterium]
MIRLLKRLNKDRSLRLVSLAGLSVVFAGLLLSFIYIKREWSYDRFHANADRLVRYSRQTGSEPLDARIWGISRNRPEIGRVPGIEDAVFLVKAETGLLEYRGKRQVVNNFYQAGGNFFEVFSFPLLSGDKASVLEGAGKAVVSQSFARRLFGEDNPVGKELGISGRRIEARTVFVSGVYEDFPETSHFHTDLILSHPEEEYNDFTYTYLLLHPSAVLSEVKQSIAAELEEASREAGLTISPVLTPLTDIHLRSHTGREMEANGNILYIYLVAGANLLLLTIVFFNLWLNAGLIFAGNRKYYRLLRLNGASSWEVLKDESLQALATGAVSILAGGLAGNILAPYLHLSQSALTVAEAAVLCSLFLLLIGLVSILPVLTGMSSTLFLSMQTDWKPAGFSLSNVRFMLIAQYSMVMFIVIMSFGVSRQIHRIRSLQVGGLEEQILVMKEQPDPVKEKYEVLKAELLQYPEIESVTSAMQLPGSSIRDRVNVRREGETPEDERPVSVLAVGEDFLPFFRIQPVAGSVFAHSSRTYQEELRLAMEYYTSGQAAATASAVSEEYVINRKALHVLGFSSPEEAVGQPLFLSEREGVSYINRGIIAGVTDDFNYTTMFEEPAPQIVLQRKNFQHCILVRFADGQKQEGLATFLRVWESVNPDYPADYAFLQDVYAAVYRNELNAQALVRIFALFSLTVANLGLIIILAFIIRRKTREIGIRKVNGATAMDIIRLLNGRFFIWIGIAFALSVPAAYRVMTLWLRNFADRTDLPWWVFVSAGLSVCLLSALSVSIPSWRASRLNPVQAMKMD